MASSELRSFYFSLSFHHQFALQFLFMQNHAQLVRAITDREHDPGNRVVRLIQVVLL